MDLWRKILLKGGANGLQILKISYMTWTSCDFEQFGYILSNWENGRGRCNLKIADIWQGAKWKVQFLMNNYVVIYIVFFS